MPTTLLKNPLSVNVTSSAVALDVTGTPADSTTASGAQPSNTLMVTGTPGQATTGTTGQTAGIGANVAITAGVGGAAPGGAVNGTGGSVTINPGPPGGGAGTAGAYGNVLLATAGGRVGIGTAVPTSTVDVVAVGNGRSFTSTRIGGSLIAASFTVRKANTGTTAVTVGHEVGNFTYSGWDGTGYILGAQIRTVVDGAVSAGNVPMAIAFSAGSALLGSDHCENGDSGDPQENGDLDRGELGAFQSNAIGERLRITSAGNVGVNTPAPTSRLHVNGGVQVGMPTGGDKGTGSINVAADIYKNGTAFTNPDYVFEHAFGGSTPASYAGPVPLAQLEDAIRERRQLPGIGREPMGVFGRQDALLEKLEEAYLYIIELTKRVARLEAERAPAAGKETV